MPVLKLRSRFLLCALLAPIVVDRSIAAEVPVEPLLAVIRDVGPKGHGHPEAMVAWQALVRANTEQLPDILAGMDGSGILAANWIRGAVETIAQRELDRGGELPQKEIERFIGDTEHSPRARRLAYELVARVDSTAEARIIPGLLNDPSLELRRDAVAWALNDAESLESKGKISEAIAAFRRAFVAARDKEQINAAAAKLETHGQQVSLPDHFGFVMRWNVIAPFDNTGMKGHDVVYPPEEEVNRSAVYKGKIGKVCWREYRTADDYGLVDFNEAFGRQKSEDGKGYVDTPESLPKHKGVIGYAYSEFFAEDDCDAEFRMGSFNGHKIWLNGELIMENHAFHANMQVDQYVAEARLRKGRNTILVKIDQNEQSESWAQKWQFQLRVCDAYGTAILSTDRGSQVKE
ncbi:MAG: hypothetical protein ACC628_02285 [Pirellulaceae bacterium]